MNITFFQRWRGNIFFVALALFLMWMLMKDNADYMKNYFHVWFYVAGWWLLASASYCAMAQFLFIRNIKRVGELGRQMRAGKFNGSGNWY